MPDYTVVRQHQTHSCQQYKDIVLAIDYGTKSDSGTVRKTEAASKTLLREAVDIAKTTNCLLFRSLFNQSVLAGFSLSGDFTLGESKLDFSLRPLDPNDDVLRNASPVVPPFMWFQFCPPPYTDNKFVAQGKYYNVFINEQGSGLFHACI